MRLPTINEKNYTTTEQLCKVLEEVVELKFAITNDLSLQHKLSEAWDVIQATKTLIYVLSEGGLEIISESNREHCDKLIDRAEKGLIGLRGEWSISTTEVEPMRVSQEPICIRKDCAKFQLCLLRYSVTTCNHFRR
jgi:hypothetical protein